MTCIKTFIHGFSNFIILKSDRNFLTFYVPKFLIVFFIWVMSICLLLWQQFRSNQDPTYDLTIDEHNYTIFRVIFLIALCVYLLYLLYLIVRAFSELKNLQYLGIFLFLIFIYMLLMFII